MSKTQSSHYEIVVLVHPDQSEHVDNMIEHFKKLVKDGSGLVHRAENWGRRHLSYSISDVFKAHYLLFNIECSYDAIESIEEWFKFNDAILRKLIIRVKSAVTTTSIMAEAIALEEKGERPAKRDDFSNRKTTSVDFKDLQQLKRYIMENGRIIPARLSGANARLQRSIARSVKLARYLSLLPYCDRHK
ncbi:MAG: hypothetical protein CMF51_01115 [Legionellales bacterium]|nr:hypothetical protein [Legionellales bacterium]|tara:strand:- start:415 stop:981 length:567 start_codon:yes stop_codon:yes gene_type:complete